MMSRTRHQSTTAELLRNTICAGCTMLAVLFVTALVHWIGYI